jgi:Protein of unknown function (DUF4238)
VEPHLAQVEDLSAPILRRIEELWPLDDDSKGQIAQFMGLQIVRGQGWRDFHHDHVPKWVSDVIEEQNPEVPPGMTQDEFAAKVKEHFRSDTSRFQRMLALVNKLASVLGSMHWSIIRFDEPLLLTSDHPVVVWPLKRIRASPHASSYGQGLLPTLEARFPLSPHLCLLMTWRGLPDEPNALPGSRTDADNINAFTRAQATPQWFHLPGVEVPLGSGEMGPLAPALLRGYSPEEAALSERRSRTSANLQPLLGKDGSVPVTIVKVNRVLGVPE